MAPIKLKLRLETNHGNLTRLFYHRIKKKVKLKATFFSAGVNIKQRCANILQGLSNKTSSSRIQHMAEDLNHELIEKI